MFRNNHIKQPKTLKQAKFVIHHQGCRLSEITEKFPELTVQQKTPIAFLRKIKNYGIYQAIWTAMGDKKDIREYVKTLNKEKSSIKIKILKISNTTASIYMKTKQKSSLMEFVLHRGCFYLEPGIMKDGLEMQNVIALEPSKIKKMLNELEEIGEAKIIRVGNLKEKNKDLTDKQKDALQLALINHYYTWPRRITLKRLSRIAGVSRSSFQENLRKAESKLFPKLIKEKIGVN